MHKIVVDYELGIFYDGKIIITLFYEDDGVPTGTLVIHSKEEI